MVHLEPHPRGWLNSPSTRLQLKATSDCVWNVSGKGLGVVIERISRCPIHSGTISCKIDDAGSHEINGVRRRDVLNYFGAAINMVIMLLFYSPFEDNVQTFNVSSSIAFILTHAL
uniref:Uncharacterized protein n=1 Tax=Lactuca sativa TaxID=4236 RepID=A0A9R1X964_LACSA|nr:hypothetical protein LSAT_V11C500246780 [Lactuca sativa]